MTFQTIIDEIQSNLKKIIHDLSLSDISFSVDVAKPGFGDVSSNIAFLLAKKLLKCYLKNILSTLVHLF